jgi:hypothetical protein
VSGFYVNVSQAICTALIMFLLGNALLEKADSHIASAEHFVVVVLSTSTSAERVEVLPTLEFDAYATILVDII